MQLNNYSSSIDIVKASPRKIEWPFFKTSIFLYVYVVHILNSIHLSFLKQQYCYCKLGNIMHGPIYLTVTQNSGEVT